MLDTPILIVGAGPAGLSLACALADAGLRSTVLDTQPHAALAAPTEDGREIALTQRSIGLLQQLGSWQELASTEISALRAARVYNGSTTRALQFASRDGALGALVPNHALRRAAWLGAQRRRAMVEIHAGVQVRGLQLSPKQAQVELADGRRWTAALVVAADGRFSAVRRMAGIPCAMQDFGRTMTLAQIEHELPHGDTALECFHHGHTMAWLPIGAQSPQRSSLVLTLPTDQAETMRAWDDARWLEWAQVHSQERLGRLRLTGARHHYPLVATYAQRFAAQRLALVGDAAVGMHPVTAHGFNFGLYGASRLASALAGSADPGAPAALQAFAQGHRRETWGIYQGTNAVVRLFTDERAGARLLRQGVLDVAAHLPPLRALITARLRARPAGHAV